MPRDKTNVTVFFAIIVTTVSAAQAGNATFANLESAAQKAYQAHQYKDAETNLLNAIDAAQTEDIKDKDIALAHFLLAKIYSDTHRPQKSDEQLQLAKKMYQRLGLTAPNLAGPLPSN